MSPPNEGGGPGYHPGTPAAKITAATKPQDHAQDATAVAVRALAAYRPCPGRGLFTYAVRCRRCRGVHLHRGGPPRADGHVRTAPCGESYVIVTGIALPALGGAA